MKTCLTIAGSDSSGGAGIQADLKTFAAHKVYGMSAITALTAQNTRSVHAVSLVEPFFVSQQIQAVFDDIRPDAIKLGMLANRSIVETVATQLANFEAQNVVLDPVMIATSGDPLLDKQAVRTLINALIPRVDIVTPNVAELVALCRAQNIDVNAHKTVNAESLERLSIALFESLPAKASGEKISILSKGGHLESEQANDLLITEKSKVWLKSERINTHNTHGTGCTLAAAICAQLALDEPLYLACEKAKAYLSNALAQNLNLGQGNGPLNHLL